MSRSLKSTLAVPSTSDELKVSFPAEHVLLLTFNRPKALNAMTPTLHADIQAVLNWFDDEPSLWYVPVVGSLIILCQSISAMLLRMMSVSATLPRLSISFL